MENFRRESNGYSTREVDDFLQKMRREYSEKLRRQNEKMQYMTSYALVIKLADRLANLSDMESLSRAYQERIMSETEFIIEFITERRELTNTHKKLIYAII